MPTLTFRKMAHTDRKRVLFIASESDHYPCNNKQFDDCIKARYQVSLACLDQDIIAFGVVTTVLDESSLMSLCVTKPYQKLGYGKRLLQHVLAHHKNNKIQQFFLEVRVSNQVAIHLYQSLNFILINRRKNYYSSKNGGEDALVFSKKLN